MNETMDPTKPMDFAKQRAWYALLPQGKKDPAIALLRDPKNVRPEDQQRIRADIARDGENWAAPYHFGWGMHIRNRLRQAGFGEEYWPVWNLDDVYVHLLEEAFK